MIKIPLRDPHEPLDAKAITDLASTLSGEEKLVTRELLTECHRVGLRTMGQVHEFIGALEPTERKAMLDALRKRLGMSQEEPAVLRTGGGWSEWQACPACGAVPVNPHTGILEPVDVNRWWCPSHRGMAGPDDLARKTSGLRYSPGGAIVEDNPAELEREQREAAYRARRHEELLKVRAVEAEEMRRRQEALDAMHRRETPPGVL